MSAAGNRPAGTRPPRRFLAIGLPAAPARAVRAATEHLRGEGARLRATSPDSWHLTLAYLGEVDVAAASQAVEVVRGCLAEVAPRPAPRLQIAGAGRFGDRVLLLEVSDDPPGALAGVVASLHTGLRETGFDLPARRFRAHVTLARAGGRTRVRAGDVARIDVPPVAWRPAAVGLWASAPPGQPGPYVVETEVAWPAPG